ncbi:hypothetical protein A6X21_12335 [Planctopirus hydrillae]|uniref:Uncharacterized protein n=1 Tax=Planctopirus hydrillae TaxID=1841610 RepID=A0A1C3E5G2_9PLAN|nr:hypothetical protein A6X21_12335 [Planctopirus hydrillae]
MRSLLADWFTTKGTKNTKEIQSQIVVSCRKYRTKSNQDVKVAEKSFQRGMRMTRLLVVVSNTTTRVGKLGRSWPGLPWVQVL